jgi:MarR family transcriptional regulator, organic hydroperoxide resistance regulator
MEKKAEEIQGVIDNLRRVFQAINEFSKNAVGKTGLTAPQLWAIKILNREAPLRVSELARRMFLQPATVVGILDRLEGKELVTRIRSKEDRRAVDLYLTELGKSVVANAPEVAQTMLVNGLDELSGEQFSCVEEGMKQIVKILEAEDFVPQPMQCLISSQVANTDW